jgi:glutathione peroxidase-family protein
MQHTLQFLKAKTPAEQGGGKELGWNFFKFVINKKGFPVKLFSQEWDAAAVEQEVYRELNKV